MELKKTSILYDIIKLPHKTHYQSVKINEFVCKIIVFEVSNSKRK